MTDSRKRQTSDPLAFPDSGPDSGADARLKALEARPEVAELKQALQKLPDIEPDPRLWAGIVDRAGVDLQGASGGAEHGRSVDTRPRFALSGFARPRFAQVAGLLLAVTAGVFGINVFRDAGLEQTLPSDQVASRPIESEAIRALWTRSRQLEPITRSYGSDPVASALRYRIADVDSQLSNMPEGSLNQEEAQRLWGQRVALLESLAEVRRARAALQPAVY